MPQKTHLDPDTMYFEWLIMLMIEKTEEGIGADEFYDQMYEEGSQVMDTDDFDLGYAQVHWCLEFTKEAFCSAWNHAYQVYNNPTPARVFTHLPPNEEEAKEEEEDEHGAPGNGSRSVAGDQEEDEDEAAGTDVFKENKKNGV